MHELTRLAYEKTFCNNFPEEIWVENVYRDSKIIMNNSFKVNILGMLLTKPFRKNGKPSKLLKSNKKNEIFYKVFKKSSGFTIPMRDLNKDGQPLIYHAYYIRASLRQLIYDNLKKNLNTQNPFSGYAKLKKEILKKQQIKNADEIFWNKNWRDVFPLDSFE
jgi:hypothetical protein